MEAPYITNPVHGGKVTCHTCGGFIKEGDCTVYGDYETIEGGGAPIAWFHTEHFNRYEHYYGLDKPID